MLADENNLYSITVPVENQSLSQRSLGFSSALEILEQRLNNGSLNHDAIDFTVPFAHPEQYIESFSYIKDVAQPDLIKLNVHFDSEALKPFLPASYEKNKSSQVILLQINAIRNFDDLNSLVAILKNINSVQSVFIQHVFSDHILIKVSYSENPSFFIKQLIHNPHLTIIETNDLIDFPRLSFEWVS